MATIAGIEVDDRRLDAVCERYGIAALEIFGSSARGAARPDSDIDILYTLKPGRRLGWKIEDLADECPPCSAAALTSCPGGHCTPCCVRLSSRRPGRCMRPDILLLSEMIDAAEQARQLAVGTSATDLERGRQRRDALL